MSQKKNTDGKVPSTKVKEKAVIKLTKTQKELFSTRQSEANASIQVIVGEFNKQHSIVLSKLIDDFILELKIDTEKEDWTFDARKLNFTKTEKKKEKK